MVDGNRMVKYTRVQMKERREERRRCRGIPEKDENQIQSLKIEIEMGNENRRRRKQQGRNRYLKKKVGRIRNRVGHMNRCHCHSPIPRRRLRELLPPYEREGRKQNQH